LLNLVLGLTTPPKKSMFYIYGSGGVASVAENTSVSRMSYADINSLTAPYFRLSMYSRMPLRLSVTWELSSMITPNLSKEESRLFVSVCDIHRPCYLAEKSFTEPFSE